MSMWRRILHPTDFSRASSAAFARAVALARADHAQLFLLHVLAPPMPIGGEGYVAPQVYEDLEASARQYAEKRLGALQAKARKSGARVTGMLLEGVADDQIIRAARRRKADLIVIGTHGRTGLARLFLGSVASRVVAGARCPVLTVRGR
ncbi:MAG TPA: universal stress protein [Methylomirabilota bacterium]|jgi:nucleotide-binding universal stress UspA family protein|nr:universal stress protein [Methylomirabilota bacterium]